MTNFKNMKIAITPEQPLDEVVRQLDRLGYFYEEGLHLDSVICDMVGYCYSFGYEYFNQDDGELTTLTELKEME